MQSLRGHLRDSVCPLLAQPGTCRHSSRTPRDVLPSWPTEEMCLLASPASSVMQTKLACERNRWNKTQKLKQ